MGPNEFGRGGDYEGGGQQEEDQVHGRGGQMFPVGSQRDLTHSLLGAAMPLMDCKYVQLLKQTPTLHIHMCCKSAQLHIPSYHPLISVDTPRIHYFTYRYLYVCDITIDSEFQQLNALHLKCCPALKMLRQFGLLKQMITFILQE